jgi:hypothetical protein
MKVEVGLWIDHRKAVIVTIEGENETIQEVQSNMEKDIRFSSGRQSNDSEQTDGSDVEDMRDRQFESHLNVFYDEIIALINKSDSIWIFGPGEAKGELEKRLRRAGFGDCIAGVETVDKLTDRQIVAKLHHHKDQ